MAATTSHGVWNCGAGLEYGAVCNLSLGLQVAFRQKMLTIFALQVFLVGVLVSALEHKAPLNVWLGHRFAKKSWVLLPFAILCVMLVVLYVLRSRFPLNWLVLVVFSMAQSVFFAALGTAFRTNIGVFNCVFTFVCICLMVVLSSVRRRDGGSDEGRLMSSFGAGMISFSISAVVASILFVLFGRSIITAEAFGLSLLFQLVLMAWFSLDASAMYQVMSPDEYMHGVIYFYTDMILLMVICAVAGMTIMLRVQVPLKR
ncbi:TPA: hypothetical protein N0F65_012406 [Lagenidium giganteum]|uniref:Chitin synthase export chaperone n=1 Tax=Lagenidium giganteum TaxID=4803 RepID=A0AAV2YRS3_9STRA|nr:TPA: hypothetical protein N0F65_012406 [Lagenidium giganteum]